MVSKDRIIQRYQNEDSEAGAITEVCTEASSSSSSDADTIEKARLKERVKAASRAVRKHGAKIYNNRLRAAFNAWFSLGKEDSKAGDRAGHKIVLQSRAERRRIVQNLGRSFKRGLSTAVRNASEELVSSTSVVHEQTTY